MTAGRTIEIIVLIVLIAITSYFYVKARKEAYQAAKLADEKAKTAKEEKTAFILTVKIDGMMCEKCAKRVTEGLSKFGEVTINLEEKTAQISSEELSDPVEVENAVTELGYKFEGIVE